MAEGRSKPFLIKGLSNSVYATMAEIRIDDEGKRSLWVYRDQTWWKHKDLSQEGNSMPESQVQVTYDSDPSYVMGLTRSVTYQNQQLCLIEARLKALHESIAELAKSMGEIAAHLKRGKEGDD